MSPRGYDPLSGKYDRRSYDEERLKLLRWMVRLIAAFLVSVVILAIAVGAYSYQGKKEQRDNSYARCVLGTGSSLANARNWRLAQERAASQGQVNFSRWYQEGVRYLEGVAGIPEPLTFRQAQRPLGELLAESKEFRERTCAEAYPEPPILSMPW